MTKKNSPAKYEPLNNPYWLRGGNLQTLYAKLLQRPAPKYRREILPDSTKEECVAYDFIDGPEPDAPLVILFHGLEGSSQSHYAIEIMRAVKKRGWHGVVAHFRSCGGIKATRTYHSGDSAEIAHMLNLMAQRHPTIYAVGVSLGGNVLAKYLGEQGQNQLPAIPQAAAIISTPFDLNAAGAVLEKGLPRFIYTPYFFKSLLTKIPAQDKKNIKLRSLADFDSAYTVPMHGFANKDDYYRRASSKPYLPHIHIPTLLLNAKNDPFYPAEHLPTEKTVSKHIYLLQPENGGHAGFVSGRGRGHLRWMPETTLRFFTHCHSRNR